MPRYIYELPNWPQFKWDQNKLATPLAAVRHRQGLLMGRMGALGFSLRAEAMLETLTLDVLKTSEIEGEILRPDQVRSSIARRLGIDIAGLVPASRHTEGIVEMMLDATQNFDQPLTAERLFGWHAALFPSGYSGMHKITVAAWRDDSQGPMQIVSGPHGRERVHYVAPAATKLKIEMAKFLDWFNHEQTIDPVLKAAIAHFWFVIIHPFDDGNGRITRAIADLQLARADNSAQRFYSMSTQIMVERNTYYKMLEKSTTLDITPWLEWFIACLDRTLNATENILANILKKARFWDAHATTPLNERQRLMLNKLLDNFQGKLTSSKWAKIAKCSQDTALRDIFALIEQGILKKEASSGKNTSYSLLDFDV